MGTLKYKALIVAATLLWGAAFVFMKDAVNVLPPAFLLGVRFLAAGAVLLLALWPHVRKAHDRRHFAAGAVLGVLNFLAFWTQTIGLDHTTPGKNAFITGLYCVIVPFVWWVLAKRRPTAANLVAAVLAVAGVGLVSLSGDASELAMGFGDAMTLVCAFFFAVHIVYMAKYADEGLDALALTVYQFLVEGVCGLAIGLCFEVVPAPSAVSVDVVATLAYLVIGASCLALLFQNIALAHVPPGQASLLLSLESVFGVVFSVLLYGEQMTPRLVVGFALIFVAVLVSEGLPGKKTSAQA